jgi:chemosensory pili system protein ChpA (sensor histidine kinase/response regulator)
MERILEGKCIFIIEDDARNLSVFSIALRKNGATVLQDIFGYGIISHIVESLPVDLIVLDIMLSRGISGYDVYDQIRENDHLKNIPVVAVTSLDPESEIPKAKARGMNGFIGKPIDAMQFPSILARVINGENVWIAGR